MKYSLSGILFESDYKSQSFDFPRFCRLAVNLGYEGVELRKTQIDLNTPKKRRSEMLRVVQNEGLSVTCLTTRGMPDSGDERDNFLLGYLELCADLKCDILKTGGDPEWMLWAADQAKPIGITLARNNHAGTDLETVKGTEEFLSSVDHPNVRLLYDSLHLYWGGEDYLDAISRFAPRIVNVLVHSIKPPIKSDGASQLELRHCMPDDPGAQDWKGIYRELKSIDYSGLVTVIESGWSPDEREGVAKRNIDFLMLLDS